MDESGGWEWMDGWLDGCVDLIGGLMEGGVGWLDV